ncbi:aldehyde dehydrogenase family protein [Massilia sp. B-10]|nr:aldehyde dehydrogenase family protein [Massilia sp. B-10]
MMITGEALIGGRGVLGNAGSFQAFDPSLREPIAPTFHMVDAAQIDAACRLADEAFDTFRATTNAERANFLETVAAQIVELGDDLIVRAMAESGLPRAPGRGTRTHRRSAQTVRRAAARGLLGRSADRQRAAGPPAHAAPRPAHAHDRSRAGRRFRSQ